jgi:pimeloyl-ACP methyl ester carboxylesterase
MIALIAAAGLALSAATPFQTSASDRLVDAAGVKLHIHCDGVRAPGAPVVVLEAGAGNSARTWNDVFAPIAQFARVCAYDRQGMGASERTPNPQGFGDVVDTLHALLLAADERPPVVMAGHSYGGALIRLYAARYPSEVTGLVLIDSSHEDQLRRFAELPPPPAPPAPAAMSASPGLPAPVVQQMTETIDLPGMEREMTKTAWRANIPLVVLTRTPPADPHDDPRGQIWQELQRELATRSPQGKQIVAKKSGHYIQNDEPPLVIDAVRRVVAKASQPS